VGNCVKWVNPSCFIIKRKGATSTTREHRTPHFVHVPPADSLAGNIVHFASDFARYCDLQEQFKQTTSFINKYHELPRHYDDISALYVLLSWVYECAPSLPVKTLNNGYRPGFPVLRSDKVNGRWRPRGYQVFGSKLIATSFRFQDEALESAASLLKCPSLPAPISRACSRRI
jgi:hypothetical protein